MRKRKKDYSAIFNQVTLAKAHQMPNEAHTPERDDPEDARGIFRIGGEIFRAVKDIRDYLQGHGMKKTDRAFDFLSTRLAPESSPNTYPLLLINQLVAAAEHMVLQQYCFFVIINATPMFEIGRVLAEPMEYYDSLIFRIRSKVAANSAMQSMNNVDADNPWPIRLLDGYIALTTDPSKFDPMQNVNIIIPGGQSLYIDVDQVNPVGAKRVPYEIGCRVRGYLRSKT